MIKTELLGSVDVTVRRPPKKWTGNIMEWTHTKLTLNEAVRLYLAPKVALDNQKNKKKY